MVQRARIVLESAVGKRTKEIAQMLEMRAATVSQWRNRFFRNRLDGLEDAPRPGKKAKYNREMEKRILNKLDTPPPEGYATWTGRLLAQSLGDVSPHHVWRILKRHGIHLQRRRSWCVSTDPEFAQKAADIVGLYLNPPENAVVISVDEKPAIQALERAQGWLRLPDGQGIEGIQPRVQAAWHHHPVRCAGSGHRHGACRPLCASSPKGVPGFHEPGRGTIS